MRISHALAAATLLVSGCMRAGRVMLELDFPTRPQWCYDMNVSVGVGPGAQDSAPATNEAHGLLCVLPIAAEPGMVQLGFHDLAITSTLLNDAEREHVRWTLCGTPIRFRLTEGVLAPVDTAVLADMQFGGWDLYRALMRALPPLPLAPVGAGDRWERERVLPLQADSIGSVAHLYQVFTLDSIATGENGGKAAHLSWTFTYRVEHHGDSLAAAPGFLRAGAGTGNAVVDLSSRCIRSAEVTFRVPADLNLAPAWQETASVALTSGEGARQ